MKKFTFKTNKSTGSYSSFYPDEHVIKFDKKQVGLIEDKTWTIRLMVVKDGDRFYDDNPNCDWKWITLANKSTSLDEAKNWLNQYCETIINKYPLHKFD